MTDGRRIVLLGMMTRIPVAGVVWQTLHYLLGLRALGFSPYYVEAHARTPSMLMADARDDGAGRAASFIDAVMRRFDLRDRWAYQALHADGRCYGMSERQLLALCREAELIVNLHGGTVPRPEHAEHGRLVYLETDPVQLQAELADEVPGTLAFLEQHCAFFTFGENWGAPDCGLPTTDRFLFRPTRQPVCMELWPEADVALPARFTTIGNWRQDWREVRINGRSYSWSKHTEFERIIDLPAATEQAFELALSAYRDEDLALLVSHGWTVTQAAAISHDIDAYRAYISGSLAEFTVAKEQNVVLRSGWFSDRSATYLAAGRPVITQETGFSNVLPTGCGLHSFSSLDEAVDAVEAVSGNYEREHREARALAEEFFAAHRVLSEMLSVLGIETERRLARTATLHDELRLSPQARRPLRLSPQTVRSVANAPLPLAQPLAETAPHASIVVVSHDNFVLTRLCVESVLDNTDAPAYELIVIDNGSRDQSRSYLRTIERRFEHVRVVVNDRNRGFAAACNQGLEIARGDLMVLLNNDTIVPPGWLQGLDRAAADPTVGLVGAVTNRIGNEAEVQLDYETYGEFLSAAAARSREMAEKVFDIAMPAMFCLALRRGVYEQIGPLDERFGPGTLEDDDYAERTRALGLRLVCCEDVLIHHFGEGSLGRLFEDGAYMRLLDANRRTFEAKWGHAWEPYGRRLTPEYELMRARIRQIVNAELPVHANVIVASRGDDELIAFEAHSGWHFPQTDRGVYAGHYPADSREAVDELELLRARGANFLLLPQTGFWWLDHYRGLARHLASNCREVVTDQACRIFDLVNNS